MGSSSKSSGTKQETQVSKPTFDSPQAQQVLHGLTSSYGKSSASLDTANTDSATKLRSLMNDNNPYVEQTVSAMEAQAPRQYNQNLAQVRTAGYRGGAGSDYINQAGLASDFANQLALNVANTRLNQFNADRGVQLQAAGNLGSLGTANQALGLSLLDALKGSSTEATSQEKSKSSTIDGGKVAAGVGTAIIAL